MVLYVSRVMNKIILTTLLLLIPVTGFSKTTIDPIDFEHIWFQDNQRNLYKRYYYYNEQVQLSSESVYVIGCDVAPDKKIKTSEGVKDALISRLYFHLQSQKYLFLVDWFNAIPQPQETEGYTYGDLLLGKTWRYQDGSSYLTLGLRRKSTPRSVVVNSETVFNATSDATEEEYSVFFHFNYHGYDLGTYYSEDRELESAAFYMPISKSDNHSLSSTMYYYRVIPNINLSERYELSLDHTFNKAEHSMRSGIIVSLLPDLNKVDISNVFTNYVSPALSNIKFIGGLYYYFDIENDENLPGAKLGIVWQPDILKKKQISFSVQQNAIGDFNALVIRDELIFTLTISYDDFY